ncbi:HTH-type transcriptional regulatory protein GabR [Paraburkholderia caffeinitolerans]|uniref:HTH-type transcriptional regulatory protein GabR n=1 Tax=Paraburkholderia caffeinitolerans TaxID=1723730 RepID=A0A6J5GP13_9BURK|nr:PLP-dependent aminotransferase family protein [Paraburkholderia caffeinitolerans]CAB3803229.1 HTH-type transcriptional regulatory protein GabR [Paraburkholderia caffeinitolerans]
MPAVLLTDMLTQKLNRDGGEPLQRQIYNVVRQAVLDHKLVVGQKLPSSRTLALELGVSRITVALAYDRLIAENYLSAKSGSGTFVAQTTVRPLNVSAAASHSKQSMMLSQRGAQIATLPGGVKQSHGAFVPGVADASAFPFHLWRRLIARHVGKGELHLSGYALGGGFAPLRAAVASYLRISRSVECEAEQVIITSGTHQSIDLCARLLADPGDLALVENPCHWAFPTVLSASGLKVGPCVLDESGLSLAASHVPRHARLVATSPSHQYPTGAVMPLARRLELLQHAREMNLWVLEDDYDSEFRYDGLPIPSLQGLDRDERVIYVGTFSKAMFPGVRLGYLVVPSHLAATFADASAKLYRPGQLHTQAALADFLGEGHFAQHIRRMRIEYAERQSLLRASLERAFGSEITLSPAHAGLHLFARFDSLTPKATLASEVQAENLIVGFPCFSGECPELEDRSIVLGFGGVPQATIGDGVARLARAVERTQRKHRGSARAALR